MYRTKRQTNNRDEENTRVEFSWPYMKTRDPFKPLVIQSCHRKVGHAYDRQFVFESAQFESANNVLFYNAHKPLSF